MNNIKTISNFAFPAVLGMGLAWLGFSFIKSERRLKNRKMELEIQLNAKSIKGI
tara:strand:- start:23 stop:184 length:162 start_codon:yes stop_codon:yes gene_type:complete